jgi:hypothetical protein
VSDTVIGDAVIPVEVVATGFDMAEPQVQRSSALVGVVDAETDVSTPALPRQMLGLGDDGRTDAVGLQMPRPDLEAVQAPGSAGMTGVPPPLRSRPI